VQDKIAARILQADKRKREKTEKYNLAQNEKNKVQEKKNEKSKVS